MRKSEITKRLDGSPLELRGKSGGYELHNVYADPDKSKCSAHRTLSEVSDRIDTVLGTQYGR